jgi:putative endonuclease
MHDHRGELDLVAWDKDVLCFVEVKTRATHDVKPAEAAVDRKKQRDLELVTREFLHQIPETPDAPKNGRLREPVTPSCRW